MVHDTGDGRRRKCDKARMYSSPGSCLANPLEEKQAGNLHNVAHIQYTAYIYIYIMEFFAKQPKLKCISTMAGLLYREKIYEKMSVPPTATLLRFPGPPAACQQKSTAAWEEKHHGLICRTAPLGTSLVPSI